MEALLKVRIAGEDEVGQAGTPEIGDALRHLSVRPDYRGSRSAADQSDTGPQIRGELQGPGIPAGDKVSAAAVELRHPSLSFGLRGPQPLLRAGHRGRVETVIELLGDGPCFGLGIPR
jgi:hypothetical protein